MPLIWLLCKTFRLASFNLRNCYVQLDIFPSVIQGLLSVFDSCLLSIICNVSSGVKCNSLIPYILTIFILCSSVFLKQPLENVCCFLYDSGPIQSYLKRVEWQHHSMVMSIPDAVECVDGISLPVKNTCRTLAQHIIISISI